MSTITVRTDDAITGLKRAAMASAHKGARLICDGIHLLIDAADGEVQRVQRVEVLEGATEIPATALEVAPLVTALRASAAENVELTVSPGLVRATAGAVSIQCRATLPDTAWEVAGHPIDAPAVASRDVPEGWASVVSALVAAASDEPYRTALTPVWVEAGRAWACDSYVAAWTEAGGLPGVTGAIGVPRAAAAALADGEPPTSIRVDEHRLAAAGSSSATIARLAHVSPPAIDRVMPADDDLITTAMVDLVDIQMMARLAPRDAYVRWTLEPGSAQRWETPRVPDVPWTAVDWEATVSGPPVTVALNPRRLLAAARAIGWTGGAVRFQDDRRAVILGELGTTGALIMPVRT